MRLLLALFLFFGCQKAKDPIEPVDPTVDAKTDYRSTSDALVKGFVYGGFGVVSWTPGGAAEHQGEALIWGGTALWSLPCEAGSGLSRALAAMVEEQGGGIIRVSPLGEYKGGRAVTLDGALGFMLGVSRRVTDCGEADLWRAPIFMLVDFQDKHGGLMHEDATSVMPESFKYVRDLLAATVGLRADPDGARKADLEKVVGGWALAVSLAHLTGQGSDACFRINLGLTSLLTVETLGKTISGEGRNQFCANTGGMDIPTVDHWCGRRPITGYISSYEPNVWEYRHQRCGTWESPDGGGNKSPQLDKLVALVMAHGWQNLQL